MFEGQVHQVFCHLQIESEFPTQTFSGGRVMSIFTYLFISASLFTRFYADDTHLTRTVPAVLRLHPQLLIPIDQAVGAAGPLAVAALQLGQPRLGVVQLNRGTQSPQSANDIKNPTAIAGRCGPAQVSLKEALLGRLIKGPHRILEY